MCTTTEARESLARFKEAYEQKMELEGMYERGERARPRKQWRPPQAGGAPKKIDGEAGKKVSGEVKGEVKDKFSVFERLVMRRRPMRKSMGDL